MTEMKAYLSIPITGHDYETQRLKAEQYKAIFEAAGIDVVTPFEVCKNISMTPIPYEVCMGRDITALLRCQMVILSPGWQQSKGCSLEYEAAKIYGLRVIEIWNESNGLRTTIKGTKDD